jgi:hypothetical protein
MCHLDAESHPPPSRKQGNQLMCIQKPSTTSIGILLIYKVVIDNCGLNDSSMDTMCQSAAERTLLLQASVANC